MYRNFNGINLEYYKAFYYVARLGSITAAADALCISQPAVSQSVKQLESALGTKLFLRTKKGIQLTKEGELLYQYVSAGIEMLMDGEQMLKRMVNLDMGEVRIGASDMTLQFFLLPYLETFHEKFPNVKVMVSNAPTPETIGSLKDGKIDFGVVSTPFHPEAEIESFEVKTIETAFVAGSRFLELKDKPLEYQCLKDYPCICLEKNTSTRAFMDHFLQIQNIILEPEFELATSDMIVQFAARNLGIGCVMADFAADKIKAGELFALTLKSKMPVRHFSVVVDPTKPVSPAGVYLLDVFKKLN